MNFSSNSARFREDLPPMKSAAIFCSIREKCNVRALCRGGEGQEREPGTHAWYTLLYKAHTNMISKFRE